MNVADLCQKWNTITSVERVNGYKSLRLPAECNAELYIGLTHGGNRCLILYLPVAHDVDIVILKMEKITIEQYRKPDYLIFTLQDKEYFGIFDDFIISLYNSIKDITDASRYTNMFIQTFHKWTKFFEDVEEVKLTKNQVKGVFGELVVLRSLVLDAVSFNVNDILCSWQGPFDRGHDFILENKNIEVKTKDRLKSTIRISSESQLESECGKNLELLVISVEEDPMKGISIKSLVEEIKLLVVNMLGDVSILLTALKQKGLTLNNIYNYSNFRFVLVNKSIYNCLHTKFPKIIKSNINASINNVKYDINITGIEDYLLSREEF